MVGPGLTRDVGDGLHNTKAVLEGFMIAFAQVQRFDLREAIGEERAHG
jgi:hypothetical protein